MDESPPPPLVFVTPTVSGTMMADLVVDEFGAAVVDENGYPVFTFDDANDDEIVAPVTGRPLSVKGGGNLLNYISAPTIVTMVTEGE